MQTWITELGVRFWVSRRAPNCFFPTILSIPPRTFSLLLIPHVLLGKKAYWPPTCLREPLEGTSRYVFLATIQLRRSTMIQSHLACVSRSSCISIGLARPCRGPCNPFRVETHLPKAVFHVAPTVPIDSADFRALLAPLITTCVVRPSAFDLSHSRTKYAKLTCRGYTTVRPHKNASR